MTIALHAAFADCAFADDEDLLRRCLFVISRQRSGTTMLRKTLSSHPDIADLGEVMHDARPVGFYTVLAEAMAQDLRAAMHSGWFEVLTTTISRLAPQPRPAALLIDIKYQMALSLGSTFVGSRMVNTLAQRLRRHGAGAIHVIRRNKLAMITSQDRARRTRVWREESTDRPAPAPVTLDIPTLADRIAREEAMDAYFATELRRVNGTITLVYEEMIGPDGALANHCSDPVAARFGLPDVFDRMPPLIKQGLPLTQAIANFDAVAAYVHALVDAGRLSPVYRDYLES